MQTLQHFFSLIKPYWLNPKQLIAWLLLIAVIGSGLAIVQVSVFVNEWNKTFYDALTAFETDKILPLFVRYLAYMAVIVLLVALGSWWRKLLIIRWRSELTANLTQVWLSERRHYRLKQNALDNPDQRIAEDAALLAEKSIDLVKYLFSNVAKLVAFIGILWAMSGVQQFELFGKSWQIHGYLVWLALIYTLICSLITHCIGRQLKPLNVQKQQAEADFRANLIRVRDNAEQIAFYRGEHWEKDRLSDYFSRIRQNWRALMNREFKLEVFSASYLRITNLLPIFAVLPLYLAKTMSFGEMMQARSAFSSVQDGFGWFMDFYKRIMEWSATVQRLWEFQQSLAALPEIENEPKRRGNLGEFHAPHLQIFLPNQIQSQPLFSPISLQLKAGEWLHLQGHSGVGKSSFLRVIGGLWQSYQGDFQLPQGKAMFLAQKSYLPQVSLAQLLCYPDTLEQSPEKSELSALLELVGLAHLIDKMNEICDWQNVLSGGEQQRLGFARVLLQRPSLLCLDESTNQLDLPSALGLLTLVKQKLPETIVIAITHQDELSHLFERHYELSAFGQHSAE